MSRSLEDLLPLYQEEQDESSDDEEDLEEEKTYNDGQEGSESVSVELAVSSGRLGEWEQHTRGVGSYCYYLTPLNLLSVRPFVRPAKSPLSDMSESDAA